MPASAYPKGGGGANSRRAYEKGHQNNLFAIAHTAWLPFLCAEDMINMALKWLLLMEIWRAKIVKLELGGGNKS